MRVLLAWLLIPVDRAPQAERSGDCELCDLCCVARRPLRRLVYCGPRVAGLRCLDLTAWSACQPA